MEPAARTPGGDAAEEAGQPSPGRCCGERGCGPGPTIDRRAFLGGLAAGAVGLAALAEETTGSPARKLTPAELADWKKTLFDAGDPIVYHSARQPHAAMPLGGIGCGNVYLDSGGRLRDWFIFNNLQPAQVPAAFFAARVQVGAQGPITRLLQTSAVPEVPGAAPVAAAELVGEYPSAALRYADPALPVELRLEALSPWLPLEARASAYPGVIFRFRARNQQPVPARLSLAAVLANPVGLSDPSGNFNETDRSEGLTTLRFGAIAGRVATLARPARLLTNAPGFSLARIDAPAELQVVRTAASQPSAAEIAAAGDGAWLWLEDLDGVTEEAARSLRQAVERGAILLLAGERQPLLNAWAAQAAGAPARADIVFEEFEDGSYARWKAEGTAFGPKPATGTLENQQPVSGWEGRYFINSFLGGDSPTGRLTSQPFTIERRYIHFLIGGGRHSGRTCLNLLVDGKVARTATGRDNERLELFAWNVEELAGKRATLEVVDQESGGWGHVNLDQIVFSDTSGLFVPAATADLLAGLLPGRFSALRRPAGERQSVNLPAAPAARPGPLPALQLNAPVEIADLVLAAGAEVVGAAAGRPVLLRRPVGKGAVYLLAAPLAAVTGLPAPRARAQAIALLGAVGGNPYSPGAGIHPEDPEFGELCLATSSPATVRLTATDAAAIWEEFERGGRFLPEGDLTRTPPGAPGQRPVGALGVEVTVPAGGEAVVPILFTWSFPNSYWQGTRVGSRYPTFWAGATSPARAAAAELERERERLVERASAFRSAIYQSTLPYWLLDCLTSQASTIRSEVCIWLGDGTFAGYEGDGGCCPMNCSHVWGYEQSLAYLFPELERNMREQDFMHQQRADGGINNRIVLPLRAGPTGERPFADGHASGILKAYREHQLSPDDSFLRRFWPRVRRAVDYLVSLDGDQPDGIIEGEQWNTYDCAIYGPNSFIGTYYLAALRAGEEMARLMGEPGLAARWRGIFESGQRRLVELCWNGEYFYQNYPGYERRPTQYGPGCLADQLIGQWWAHQLGLGYLLPAEHVRTALRSVFRHNWLPDMADWRHRQRVFADQHDKGLLCCTWPRGGRPPGPILYCDEVWTGVEYQVAGHMIYEGMLDEAFAIIRGARERYDGTRRNPWNEIECGGHYARAMSSWGILLALSGLQLDGPRGRLGFHPRLRPEQFQAFFSTGSGWGSFRQERRGERLQVDLAVRHGVVSLTEFRLGLPAGARARGASVSVDARAIPAAHALEGEAVRLTFSGRQEVPAGRTLTVELTL